MKHKVLMIGLDGARMDILARWCEQGYLPNINKLINKGVSGNLRTILPIHSFPAWTSISTGTIPPKHGIYDILLRKNEEDYSRIPPSSKFVKVRRFWELLDELGYGCAIINVPVTYPPKPLKNGIIVSSVLTPSMDYTFAHPKNVLEMLRGWNYKILPTAKPGTGQYIKEVNEILEKQYQLVRWFMDEYDWDCIFWVVMSTEMLHHHYASFVDPNHPLYNPEFEKVVRDIYIKIDKYIGEIMETLKDEEFTIFLVSDHGFAPYYGTVYMNAFLRKWGFLKTKPRYHLIRYHTLKFLKKYGKWLYNYLPKNLKERAIRITGFGASEFTLNLIDWSKTKAYVAMLDGHIFINLEGREKYGTVRREEYEKVVNEIINKITSDPILKDIVEEVKKKEDIYKEGEYLDLAPDIFLIFKDANKKPFKIRSDPFAKELITYNLRQFEENIGYHTLDGIFIAYGDSIRQNYHRNATVLDIAPTVLSIFGISPPKYMDGIVLEDIFVNNTLSKNKIDLEKYKIKGAIFRIKQKLSG